MFYKVIFQRITLVAVLVLLSSVDCFAYQVKNLNTGKYRRDDSTHNDVRNKSVERSQRTPVNNSGDPYDNLNKYLTFPTNVSVNIKKYYTQTERDNSKILGIISANKSGYSNDQQQQFSQPLQNNNTPSFQYPQPAVDQRQPMAPMASIAPYRNESRYAPQKTTYGVFSFAQDQGKFDSYEINGVEYIGPEGEINGTTFSDSSRFTPNFSIGIQHFSPGGGYAAIEAFYQHANYSMDISNSKNVSGNPYDATDSIDLNGSYGVKARLGAHMHKILAVYGIVGYGTVNADLNLQFAAPSGASYGNLVSNNNNINAQNIIYGAGAEISIGDNLGLFVEYQMHNISGTTSMNSDDLAFDVDREIDIVMPVVSMGIRVRF